MNRRTLTAGCAALVATMLSGCIRGEVDIDGQLGNAYGPGVIATAVVGAQAEVAGERGRTLTLSAIDDLPGAGPSATPGEVAVVEPYPFEAMEGAELTVFLGRWLDGALQLTYAIDPATDLPVPGFDAALPDGTPQAVILDCLADSYGTTGPHRREEALRSDAAADGETARLGACLDANQDWDR